MKPQRQIKRHPLSIAWDEWLASDEGKKCDEGNASGIYLQNRLQRAFMAGAEATNQDREAATAVQDGVKE